jgi:hydrogenase nickel incorporation protein HypA/HybF
MHEYAIVQSLLARVEQEAESRGATHIKRLEVRIGEQAGVDVDLLMTAFETFRSRSICDRANLSVTHVAAEWRCPRCDTLITPGSVLRCARCDMPATMTAGDEIYLDRIEMEVRDV